MDVMLAQAVPDLPPLAQYGILGTFLIITLGTIWALWSKNNELHQKHVDLQDKRIEDLKMTLTVTAEVKTSLQGMAGELENRNRIAEKQAEALQQLAHAAGK